MLIDKPCSSVTPPAQLATGLYFLLVFNSLQTVLHMFVHGFGS